MKRRKVFCVTTGMHRSGTTWLGNAVGSIPHVFAMEEPFNFDYGLAGVPRWYVDSRSETDVAFTRSAIDGIETSRVRYRHKTEWDRPLATLSTKLRGNGSERGYRRFLKTDDTLIALKDPFLLMMIPTLVDMGVKVVVSVRHPAAILKSLRRMNWHIPNEHLIGRAPGGDVSTEKDGDIVAISGFWSGVYRPLIDQLKTKGGEGIYVAFHETMFDDVEALAQSLATFLELDPDDDAGPFLRFVRASTSARTVQPGHSRQHDLARDSKALAHAWRKAYPEEDLAAFDRLVGADYNFLRGEAEKMIHRIAQAG